MKDNYTRKQENEKSIAALGIAVNPYLPLTENEDDVEFRSLRDTGLRAFAAYVMARIAHDHAEGIHKHDGHYNDLMKTEMMSYLNPAEQKVRDGTAAQQDLINVIWQYECSWALLWALGRVTTEELENVSCCCDVDRAEYIIFDQANPFFSSFEPRSKEEILDELDYFYRLHWACVEHRLRPGTPIGDMNEEVVYERRRALEWLISDRDNWFDIELHT